MLGGWVVGDKSPGGEAMDDAVADELVVVAARVVAARAVAGPGWPAQAMVIIANRGHRIVEGWPRAGEAPGGLRGASERGAVRQARADLTSWDSMAMPGSSG
ncbi:MAG TPA: hypothetical protein VFK02_18530 [Kofleriaceae bacterium]|nr:hypothetical protein [Kofleriaceae bacterium]